jgi:glycosyltransferase involved in cell wall biosynthesis
VRILVIHQNFPGQFGHLVRAWAARPGWQVRALGRQGAPGLQGFGELVRYPLPRAGCANQHPYLHQFENAVLHGQSAVRAMLEMRQGGFKPDVILAHPGWGESLYARDVFPDARLIHLCEWYYSAEGADVGFDPEFPISLDDRARVRTWNAQHALNLLECDAAISPTHWQKSRYPAALHDKIVVQHEGIDTQALGPDFRATFTTPSGVTLRAGDPVITYVARNLEPYRGFHVFMRALEKIQRAHPGCHALIVGGDEVSYGRRPKGAAHWRERMLKEVTLDPCRTHFLGRLPRQHYLHVLQVSACHVYLTYPFVLSWSVLEAMACGVPIVASDTAPVREVIEDGKTGQLVDFFDTGRIVQTVLDGLASTERSRQTGRNAREHAQRYSLEVGLAGYDRLLKNRDESQRVPEPRRCITLRRVTS